MIQLLIENAMHSSPQAFLGIGIILVYFIGMISAIIYRIFRGEHMDH